MVHVGTSGYSYKDWIGPFYPEGTRDGYMLDYYAGIFDFVEINSSFYHMPGLQLFKSIDKRTSGNFRTAVKIFRGFTHEREFGAAEALSFINSIKPVVENGKLACLLAQFPYSFHYNQQNLDHLKRLREWFGDIPVNIEFRGQDWIKSDVMRELKAEKLGFVCVDEPGIKGLVKSVAAATSEVSYLRMHGRNGEKWYSGEGPERYDYLYKEDELMEWVPRIWELERHASNTYIAFNNHPKGKAVENAKMMLKLLSGASV